MTKAEAVKLIDERMCFGRGKWSEHHMPEIDDYWEAGQMAIKALEQPPHKKGKWIDGYKRQTCSVCRQRGYRSWNFCPNCGSYNGGEQDEYSN